MLCQQFIRRLQVQAVAQEMSRLGPTRNTAVRQDVGTDGCELLGMLSKQRQHRVVLDEIGLNNHAVKIENHDAGDRGLCSERW
jgi:hypothetical protein